METTHLLTREQSKLPAPSHQLHSEPVMT